MVFCFHKGKYFEIHRLAGELKIKVEERSNEIPLRRGQKAKDKRQK
jgi:hypothetical protein